jgi:branched-chain amino acid transport system substrate-binding protein
MTRDTKRRDFLKIAGTTGAIGMVGLSGCSGDGGDTGDGGGDGGDGGGGTTAPGDQVQTITLGGSMSLSGDNADLGQLYDDSYNLAIDTINEMGGFEGGDGNTYEFDMELRDDESNASNAQSIYRELINQEGIDYLLGPYSSTVTLPASAIAASNQVPMVEAGGASTEIFSQGNEWIFGLLPTADRYAVSMVDMAANQSQTPEVGGLLVQDDAFSVSAAKGVRPRFEEHDIDLAVDRTFPTETSDLSTELGAVRDADVDVLIMCAHQKHAVVMAQQLESQQVNVDMAGATVGTLSSSFKDDAGDNGDYLYGPTSWDDSASFSDPVFGDTAGFVEAFTNRFDYQPDYHNAAGACVITTYMDAMQRVDEVAPTPVRDAVRESDFETLYGNIQFLDNGAMDISMLVQQWQPDADGKVLVWPENIAQGDPVYPMPDWSER